MVSIMGPEEDDKIEANRLPYAVERCFGGGENGWRPIKSAPKDGTDIIVARFDENDDQYAVAQWWGQGMGIYEWAGR